MSNQTSEAVLEKLAAMFSEAPEVAEPKVEDIEAILKKHAEAITEQVVENLQKIATGDVGITPESAAIVEKPQVQIPRGDVNPKLRMLIQQILAKLTNGATQQNPAGYLQENGEVSVLGATTEAKTAEEKATESKAEIIAKMALELLD